MDCCSLTGYSQRYLIARLDDAFIALVDGVPRLDPDRFPGCNRFNVASLAAELSGSTSNSRRLAAEMRNDPRYPWIFGFDVDGNPLVWATHINSAQAWFDARAAAAHTNQVAHLRRGLTDCSGGGIG